MVVEQAKAAATSGAAKATGAIGGLFGGADYAEGGGFDKAAAAAGEVATGLGRAAQVAGDTLRNMFGGLPWEMGGQEVAEAASSTIIDVAVMVI